MTSRNIPLSKRQKKNLHGSSRHGSSTSSGRNMMLGCRGVYSRRCNNTTAEHLSYMANGRVPREYRPYIILCYNVITILSSDTALGGPLSCNVLEKTYTHTHTRTEYPTCAHHMQEDLPSMRWVRLVFYWGHSIPDSVFSTEIVLSDANYCISTNHPGLRIRLLKTYLNLSSWSLLAKTNFHS